MDAPRRDPVCGMLVSGATALTAEALGQTWAFCSEVCRTSFLRSPRLPAGIEAGGLVPPAETRIAYFSMEFAVDPRIPTYAGGLGVLAGDTLRAFADLHVPVVGVTLASRAGYFRQRIARDGTQREEAAPWSPEALAVPLDARVTVKIARREVRLRAWRYDVQGFDGYRVPLLLIDADLAENGSSDRRLTDELYGGDEHTRLAQEAILGIGGVRLLDALGYRVQMYHLNEGHAALAAIAVLQARLADGLQPTDFDFVRHRCIFTTHTPVPAGHDQFEWPLVREVLEAEASVEILRMLSPGDRLNMTRLALELSFFVNGVARRHRDVSREMFPGHKIQHVTNGVHSPSWTSPPFAALYDRYVPEWREDPAMLRKAVALPAEEIWSAHLAARARLFEHVRSATGTELSPDALTVCAARRATPYKRTDLVLYDPGRLKEIAAQWPLQLVFAGKAHPRDDGGREMIRRIAAVADGLRGAVPVLYLEEYNLDLAGLLVAGGDLWLNTPRPPLEASGTSGMKAAHNGVPSLSILDGWWLEGHVENVTGWSIGDSTVARVDASDADSLYRKLNDIVAPLFHRDRGRWIDVMRGAIALNASFFNAHRMVQQYVTHAYLGARSSVPVATKA